MSARFVVKSGSVEIPTRDPHLRSFLVPDGQGGNCRVNVWESGMFFTVGTALSHPTKGKTQLFRRKLTCKDVEEILRNPRKHTGKGYYRK